MYLYHFGMRELPFTLTPNTSYFYGLPSHQQALQVLLTALQTGEGFIKVTGEVGTGKTLLCRKLLNELPAHFVAAYIPNPYLSASELRRAVAHELGIDTAALADDQLVTQHIQQRIIELNQQNKAVVLIVDEAQALPLESLEALRLFTNLETESRKLLQVVLFGQPELDEKLGQRSIRQLKQRISFSFQLTHMDEDQTFHYVKHRIEVAGFRGDVPFDRGACKLLFKASHGIPRIVNVLCHKALMLAYGEGKNKVTRSHVRLAIKDTEAAHQANSYWRLLAAFGLGALLIAGVWTIWHMRGGW